MFLASRVSCVLESDDGAECLSWEGWAGARATDGNVSHNDAAVMHAKHGRRAETFLLVNLFF